MLQEAVAVSSVYYTCNCLEGLRKCTKTYIRMLL